MGWRLQELQGRYPTFEVSGSQTTPKEVWFGEPALEMLGISLAPDPCHEGVRFGGGGGGGGGGGRFDLWGSFGCLLDPERVKQLPQTCSKVGS